MKKLVCRLLLYALVFGMLPLYATETRAQTISLLNGGFDSGLTGWSMLNGNIANMIVTSEIKYSGGFSLKIKDMENNTAYAMISDKYPVSPGKTYTATAKLYLVGGSGSIYLYFYDAAGTRIHSAFSGISAPQSQWTDVKISSDVPAGAVNVSVVLATSKLNVGTAYYDHVGLSAAVPLANGGFESGLTGWNAAYGGQQQMTVTAEASFAGANSLKIVDNSSRGAFGMESDKFPVIPGTQYTAGVKVRTETGTGAIYLRFYDASNRQLEQKSTGAGTLPGQWQSISATLTAPEDAVSASVLLYSDSANTGTLYFDETSISEASLIRGSVSDAVYGSPVPWANAYLYRAADTGFTMPLDKAVTGQSGKFVFARSVDDGAYTVRAMKDGYLHGTAAVEADGTGNGSAAVTLVQDTAAARYTVSGKVRLPDANTPIAGANIALYDDNDVGYTTSLAAAVSAADGTFTLDQTVPSGRYMARAVKAGYYTTTFPAAVRDRNFIEIELRMPSKENVTEQNMPKPPAVHPRLYVTPELVPQLQAKVQTPAYEHVWGTLVKLSYIPEYTGRSTGKTLGLERYEFPAPENARYVKIFGRGNSVNQWNSITETEIYTRNALGVPEKLAVQGAAWSSQDQQYDGNKTIDGNFDPESRWSAEGPEEWISYDIGALRTVTDIGVAWHSGNVRSSYFDIYVSDDGQNWRLVDLGMGRGPGMLDQPPAGQTNYSAALKNAVEYNAMKYLLTGDVASGRLAIRTILNFMDTVVYAGIDTFRAIGDTIHAAAVTYDWSYPLLTSDEKTAFIAKLKTLAGQMEMGYPPVQGSSIRGHSSENILMKDLLAAGIAIYDEEPEMYNVSAIRFFAEFVPARNFWYLSGMHPQGDSYGFSVRLMPELWAQWMFARMGYPDVFIDEQRDVLYRGLYLRRPDGQLMRDGDTTLQNYSLPGSYWKYAPVVPLLGASYYKDPYLQGEFLRQYAMVTNLVTEILFADLDVPASPVDELPLTRYFGFPYGTMIARTGWNMDGPEGRASDVVAEMKIGNYQFGNHQHLDMGSFQLYYKGALAIDSGMYQGKHGAYGSEHDNNYYKRTIAHNGMLVYDPAERFYAGWANDGGQLKPPEVENLTDLLGKQYYTGQVAGHQFGPDPAAPDFSYIKGDLTAAYTDKVKQFKRSFMFLNLKDNSHPAAMIVYDKVVSSDPNFKKYWLLHSMEEPVVTGNTTTIRRSEDGYGGKLVNETLLPQANNTVIEKIGGPGREFEVSGTNYLQEPSREPGQHTVEAGAWRVQISPQTPSETDHFLNVLQVMDDNNASPLAVSAIDSDRMVGAAIADSVVLFSKSGDRETGALTFSVPGNEQTLQFAVADLTAGTWHIAGGGKEAYGEVGEEGGVLYFHGAPGAYTLTYIGAQDLVPPETFAHIDGKSGPGTFNDRNVTVTFSTYELLSGIDRTEYKLNGGAWTTVTDSVYLTGEGIHTLDYRSVDRTGNMETPKQVVIGIDKTPPTLRLNGKREMSLFAGTVFTDPGSTAEDLLDSGVNGRVEVAGGVNTGVPGAYEMTYRVADAAGNASQPVTRTVHVIDPAKVAKLQLDSPIYLMSPGERREATVTATVYGDGRLHDVTPFPAYASDHPDAAHIAGGVITAVGDGASLVTASYGGYTAWAVVSTGSNVGRTFQAVRKLLDQYAALGELAAPLQSQLDNRLRQAEHQWNQGHRQQALKQLDDFLDAVRKHTDKVSAHAAQTLGEGVNLIVRALSATT